MLKRVFNYRLLCKYDTLWSRRLFSNLSDEHNVSAELDLRKVAKFSNVLNQLQQTAPFFSESNNELGDFNDKLQQIRSSEDLLARLDKYIDGDENYHQLLTANVQPKAAGELFLANKAALVYPDLDFWNREVSIDFLTEYTSALLLGIIDFAQTKGLPELAKYEDKFAIVIARNANHFLLEFDRSQLSSADYGKLYPTLCEVVRFILRFKTAGAIEFGFLSTLNSVDALVGVRYLNPSGLARIEEADLYVNFEHVDELDEELKSIQTYDQQLTFLSRQLYQSNVGNVASRWFSKPMQFVVILNRWGDKLYGNGLVIDKQTIPITKALQIVDHGVEFLTKFKMPEDATVDQTLIQLHKVDLLQEKFEEMVKVAISDFAKERYRNLIQQDVHYDVLNFDHYGRQYLESINLNAEAWMQIAVYKAASMMLDMPISVVYRPEREDNPNMIIDTQCLSRELVEFLDSPMCEDKLRIAAESNHVFTRLAQRGYSLNNTLQSYAINLPQIVDDGDEASRIANVLGHSIVRRLLEPSITIEPTPSRYAMSMVASNDFRQSNTANNMSVHFNLTENQILFTIVNFQKGDAGNDKVVAFKDNLNQCLHLLKNVIQS